MSDIQWTQIEDQYTVLLFDIFNSPAPVEWRLKLLGKFQEAFALAPTIGAQADVIAQTRARLVKGCLGSGMPQDEIKAPQNAF